MGKREETLGSAGPREFQPTQKHMSNMDKLGLMSGWWRVLYLRRPAKNWPGRRKRSPAWYRWAYQRVVKKFSRGD